MTMPQDTDLNWISFKDLQKNKMCQVCRKLMTIKQINLTEACRACFNEKCCPELLDVPDMEYIQRSYRDMELGKKQKGFLNVPVSLENEVDEVNKLFSEVESMVSHRLGEEYWNEVKMSSCSKIQAEDLNHSDQLLCNKSEQLDVFIDDDSKNFRTEDAPILHLEQPVSGKGTSIKEGLPRLPQHEEQQLELCWSLHTESTNTINIEQKPASNAGLDSSNSTYENECVKLSDTHTPLSIFDIPPNEVWRDTDAKAVDIDFGKDLPAYDARIDSEPSNESIISEMDTSALNSDDIDIKDNLLELNSQISAVSDFLNLESKPSELLENKTNINKIIKAEDVKTRMADNLQEELTGNSKAEVNEDFDCSVKITNGFRCYRPRKKIPRNVKADSETKTSKNRNLLEKWSSMSVTSKVGASNSYLDQPIEKKENFELFKDTDPDFQNCLQHTDVSVVQTLGQVTELQRKVELSVENYDAEANGLLLKKDVNVHALWENEKSNKLNLVEPLCVTSDPIKSDKSPPEARKKVSTKPIPSKTGTSSTKKASLRDVPKGIGKPLFGFNELKRFGGAKSSIPTAEVKSKSAKPVRGRKKINSGKTENTSESGKTENTSESGKTENTSENGKTENTSVNDCIEKAIADVQYSNVNQNVEWDPMFLDILN